MEHATSFTSILIYSKLYNVYSKSTTKRWNSVISVEDENYFLIHEILLLSGNPVCVMVCSCSSNDSLFVKKS